MARASSRCARLARHLYKADHSVRQRRRRWLRMRHRADVRHALCSDQARFGEVFIRRGLIPEAGGLFVLPPPGWTRTRVRTDLERRHHRRRASRANRDGEQVVPHAQLGEATAAFAKKIAAQAPLAQRLAKETLRVGLNLNLPYFFDYQRHGQHLMLTSRIISKVQSRLSKNGRPTSRASSACEEASSAQAAHYLSDRACTQPTAGFATVTFLV